MDKQTNIDVGRNVFWPRDLLPGKVPDIRILTYGYDSNVVNGKNKNGIYQHAENMLSALQRIRLDVRSRPDVRYKLLELIAIFSWSRTRRLGR